MSSTGSNRSNNNSNSNSNENNNENSYGLIGAVAAVAAGIGLYMALKDDKTNEVFESPCAFQTSHKRKIIDIVDTADKCKRAVNKIQEHCQSYNVVGLDCEWSEVEQQQTIQLLQIATDKGYCALFRLPQMKTIPQCLKDLLKSKKIIKVGIGIHRHAVHLKKEFDLTTEMTLDINFFTVVMKRGSGTLKVLAFSILNNFLNRNKKLSRSDWSAAEIEPDRIQYTADDAIAIIEIFKKLADQYIASKGYPFERRDLGRLLQRLESYFDMTFAKDHHNALPPWV